MNNTLFLTAVVALGFEFMTLAAQSAAPLSVFTEAQATVGRAAYESVCVNCHAYVLSGRNGDPSELPTADSLVEPFRQSVHRDAARRRAIPMGA